MAEGMPSASRREMSTDAVSEGMEGRLFISVCASGMDFVVKSAARAACVEMSDR